MCVDLNRCLYYSDARGEHFDAPKPIRTVLTVIDGIIAGDGDGPLAPADVPLGAVLAATDPVALDLACVRLMGFDEENLPKIRESMRADNLRITSVHRTDQVRVVEVNGESFAKNEKTLEELSASKPFNPHPGWRNHVERS
jgi:uncharacterized protein (DUF362 family)